jgi:hypothetical protein
MKFVLTIIYVIGTLPVEHVDRLQYVDYKTNNCEESYERQITQNQDWNDAHQKIAVGYVCQQEKTFD